MCILFVYTLIISEFALVYGSPSQGPFQAVTNNHRFYDVQAHRGGRGNVVESILPSFAWGLIDGATILELDNGITQASLQDGEVVVWHDEQITAEKCSDTAPAVPDDPAYPYVGKYITNLTLAQIKTLDCGSKRQTDFPHQLVYPGARVSTLWEVFDFVACADPSHQILWNIESKINPQYPNRTAGVDDFVQKQHEIFLSSPYYRSITYQSFDWRTLMAMKKLDNKIITSALIDEDNAFTPVNLTSPWLAGLRLESFPGPSLSKQMAQAAHSIQANILSPTGTFLIPSSSHEGFSHFTTPEMISEAHRLGMKVIPFTVNRLDRVEELIKDGADGIITDYPNVVRRWAKQQGLLVAPKYPKQRVFSCLYQHMQ
ncbi:PLC-like phosphodiesterase [Rhizopogon vinicolor AM-OR11-026]|uniref:PLC-like phosphodiesterase n=1 Tax=Rhizopogon vinicolor AM-OR11-026 TaxID=1314800 RepID=A0A1B7NJG7_9AGAM|nr:PLC-like phosphodiesterase [Rhizopogon vinicolor AM-OR11-026]